MRNHLLVILVAGAALGAVGGETLYNGIVLPDVWPPAIDSADRSPMRIPYLKETNRPAVIPIDLGRQLFVDDFLVASSEGVVRHFYKPVKYLGNPLLRPETAAERALDTELGERPYPPEATKTQHWLERYKTAPCCAMPGGGVWWDPTRRRFRMWYLSGWTGRISYVESEDAVNWTRPNVGPRGDNVLLPDQRADTWSVWPDFAAADPYSSWKLWISPGGNPVHGVEYVSKDGIHWEKLVTAGLCGDSTTMFYNPFRGKWVWSIRAAWRDRSRVYHEHSDFVAGAEWTFPVRKVAAHVGAGDGSDPRFYDRASWINSKDCALWLACDNADGQRVIGGKARSAQLYNVDAVPYESLMVGLFKILCGRDNGEAGKAGMPKTTSVHFAYSRDGFHFDRPDRTPAIPDSGWGSGEWDSGYLGPCSSGFVIKDERLWIFYSAVRGDASQNVPPLCTLGNGMHWNFSIGAATLRRDGFAGMVADGLGEIVTRPVRFAGRHLFVNANAMFGDVAAEVLDEKGVPIPGFTAADCSALSRRDSTKAELVFKGGDLGRFAGRSVHFRFKLHTSTLYAFWVSPSKRGESGGYVAAGGPDYPGTRDL